MEEIKIKFQRSKKILLLVLILSFLLSGCFNKEVEESDPQTNIEENLIISPNVSLNEEYYRGVLPYKVSPINGMLREIPSRLDNKYFELGLLEFAKDVYDPAKYIFQDGQVLTMNEIEPLLDKDQYPQFEGFVYAVTEHDYLLDGVEYGGLTVGILVSQKYELKDQNGETVRDANGLKVIEYYTDEELKEKSQRIANELLSIIRRKIDVPVLFAFMKAEADDLKVPGTFFLSGKANEKGTNIEEWKAIDESYLFLPAPLNFGDENGNIIKIFNHFNEMMDEYLPGFSGITGLAKIKEGKLVEITIKVYTEFDSTTESIQFTQFAISMINKYFPEDININLYISTIEKPKAIYIKTANGNEFMHIYKD